MKILQVIPSVSPTFGGPSQVALNLTKALRELGVDVEIATTNDNSESVLDVPLGQRVEYNQVPVWFFSRCPWRMKEFLFSSEFSRWLWLNLPCYDLATAHYLFSYAPTCLAIAARKYNIPYGVRTIGQPKYWTKDVKLVVAHFHALRGST